MLKQLSEIKREPIQTHKDELCDYRITLEGNTGGEVGDGKEKGSLRANIASILENLTAEEKTEKDGKAEMVSEL